MSVTSNSQLPYEFCKESDWNYSFITISGVKYIAYFVDYSVYHPDFDEVYTFILKRKNQLLILLIQR